MKENGSQSLLYLNAGGALLGKYVACQSCISMQGLHLVEMFGKNWEVWSCWGCVTSEWAWRFQKPTTFPVRCSLLFSLCVSFSLSPLYASLSLIICKLSATSPVSCLPATMLLAKMVINSLWNPEVQNAFFSFLSCLYHGVLS